jgi:hypothetical protein
MITMIEETESVEEQCRDCGKAIGYDSINGYCGPCYCRHRDDRVEEFIETAQEYDHIATVVDSEYRPKYRWKGYHYRMMARRVAMGNLLPGPVMVDKYTSDFSKKRK